MRFDELTFAILLESEFQHRGRPFGWTRGLWYSRGRWAPDEINWLVSAVGPLYT